MNKVSLSNKIGLLILFFLSVLPIIGLPVSDFTVFLGIIFYIVINIKDKTDGFKALDPQVGYENFIKKGIRLWIFAPAVINILVFLTLDSLLPEFFVHIAERTLSTLSGGGILLFIQLPIAALGEEIAWRGFFQEKISRLLGYQKGIIITSLLFALAHFTPGVDFSFTLLDMSLVFLNSVIYGIVYSKTENVVLCSLSHLAANFVAIILLGIL